MIFLSLLLPNGLPSDKIPLFTQLDMSASYTWDDRLTIYAEGINLLEEDQRKHGRHKNMVVATIEGGARYSLGVRYKF